MRVLACVRRINVTMSLHEMRDACHEELAIVAEEFVAVIVMSIDDDVRVVACAANRASGATLQCRAASSMPSPSRHLMMVLCTNAGV